MHAAEDTVGPQECSNCGATRGLLRCSRCRTSLFCSPKCQKAYWPIHKPECQRNEFADVVEGSDPKFARWMRQHGKLAVLKDDEVERLERAAVATTGYTKSEVMDSMYGRLEPKPAPAEYSLEERARMRDHEELEMIEARLSLRQDREWKRIDVAPELGLDCGTYKWRQNQSLVEVFVQLPPNVEARKVRVELTPTVLIISVDGDRLLGGALAAEIKQEESSWQISDGILELTLLKRSRRGNYANGHTNANTFWRSVWQGTPEVERLQGNPPVLYYSCHIEPEAPVGWKAPLSSKRARPMIDRSRESR